MISALRGKRIFVSSRLDLAGATSSLPYLVSCLWRVRRTCASVCVCVSVDDWVAKLQSERVCPYLGQAFLARMQCDTVTILMPNTYSITHSAKIWYPYRFFFLIFSPQCSSHFFSLLWFYFFLSLSYIYRIQMHVSVMLYKRCQTIISFHNSYFFFFSYLLYVVFFCCFFCFCFCFNRHALWHLHRYTHTFINRYICKSVCILMHLCVCVFHVVFSTRTLNISYNAVKKKTLY